MDSTIVKRYGDRFHFTWPELPIEIIYDQLRDDHHECKGELSVYHVTVDDFGQPLRRQLLQTNQNLSSYKSRHDLSNSLSKRNGWDKIPWETLIEKSSLLTMQQFRQGEPVLDLSTEKRVPRPRWLLYPFLMHKSVTVLYGDAEATKSYLALCLSCAISLRQTFLPHTHMETGGRVLFLDWETWAEDHMERLDAISAGLGLERPPEILYRRMQRTLIDDASVIRSFVSELDISLLVIDSLGFAIAAELKDSGPALQAMSFLASLPCSTLALAHVSKESAANTRSAATIFGSAFFRNGARCAWEAVRGEDTLETSFVDIGLYQRKMNRGAKYKKPLGYRFNFEGTDEQTTMVTLHSIDITDDTLLLAKLPLKQQVISVLRGGPQTLKGIATMINAKDSSVKSILYRFKDTFVRLGHTGDITTDARVKGDDKGLWALLAVNRN